MGTASDITFRDGDHRKDNFQVRARAQLKPRGRETRLVAPRRSLYCVMICRAFESTKNRIERLSFGVSCECRIYQDGRGADRTVCSIAMLAFFFVRQAVD